MQGQEVGLKAEVIVGPRRNPGLFVKAILGPGYSQHVVSNKWGIVYML